MLKPYNAVYHGFYLVNNTVLNKCCYSTYSISQLCSMNLNLETWVFIYVDLVLIILSELNAILNRALPFTNNNMVQIKHGKVGLECPLKHGVGVSCPCRHV